MTEPNGELVVRVASAPGPRGRAARSRAAILEAATRLFLEHGYDRTGTDQVATEAAVSKQTVYNQFGDKERLFAAVVLGVTATAERFAGSLPATVVDVRSADDLAPALGALARRYLTVTTDPQVLAVRRLVIGEARRFPELAARYWERAPARVLAGLAAVLDDLGGRGLLAVPDPPVAAEHFAYLVLGPSLDRGLFEIERAARPPEEIERSADAAVEAFLGAYRG